MNVNYCYPPVNLETCDHQGQSFWDITMSGINDTPSKEKSLYITMVIKENKEANWLSSINFILLFSHP